MSLLVIDLQLMVIVFSNGSGGDAGMVTIIVGLEPVVLMLLLEVLLVVVERTMLNI